MDPTLSVESLAGTGEHQRILRLSGPLTLQTLSSSAFPQTLRADLTPVLILDLTGVHYADSAGIGTLVGAQVSRSKDGRRLMLVGANERVLNALRISHLDQVFALYSTVSEALSG